MIKRRDARRFGSGPYLLRLNRDRDAWANGFRTTCWPAVGDLGAALLGVIARAAEQGAQFIIATHSPILLPTSMRPPTTISRPSS
jgi:hypothetical protein